jgi:hypothetical protein
MGVDDGVARQLTDEDQNVLSQVDEFPAIKLI